MANKRKKISDAQIQAFMDEAMDAKSAALVEKDLSQDTQTRQRLEEARLLRHTLRSSAPVVPSEAMWAAIRRDLSKTAPGAFASPSAFASWKTWLQLPAIRLAFGAACVALVLVGLSRQEKPSATRARAGIDIAALGEVKTTPANRSISKAEQPIKQAETKAAPEQPLVRTAAAPAKKRESAKKENSLVASALRNPNQPRPALPTADKVSSRRGTDGLTDVERALQAGDLDSVILALRQRQDSLALTPQPDFARTVSMSSAPATSFQSAPKALAFQSSQPTMDADGFWNWRSPAIYMNQKNWAAAGAEFDRARREANEAAERSFGASARLSMNQVQGIGDDLGLGDLRRYPGLGLVVLKSGAWQLLVPNRQARFQGGVQTRISGYRTQGDGFTYEMNFDRGTFAPGTQFTRMAGELATEAVDADGKTLVENNFTAPRGAEFIFATGELRLK